jgi:membrane protein implicated in regulation of membrane protease activity
MDAMFWVWLAVIVGTAVAEFATMELVSIWFSIGAIIPFILAGVSAVSWEFQIIIFIAVSALLIISLRKITKKFLLRNSNGKTNMDAVIGTKVRMIDGTDFDTIGTVKVNDVVWNAVGENQENIEKGSVVEIVRVKGNKLIVKKIEEKIEKEKK